MKPQQMRKMLQQTIEDFRLSRGERQALSQILGHFEPTEEMLTLYRSIAFELAQDTLAEAGPQAASDIIGWLEGVAKTLQSRSASSRRTTAAESYFSPGDDCPRRIGNLLRATKETAELCVFTITDDRISDEIIAAFRRGVAVRVISDDDKANDLGSDVNRLEKAGIPVRVDRTRYHMHHKFALFDGAKLLTGSYNWTRSAASNNEENFIVT
ncbi:MAG: hypothetical protein IID45_02800, partial [Planctomycetes bacterium]|nr:hypothetical protein [Planctomycetota bacterium]